MAAAGTAVRNTEHGTRPRTNSDYWTAKLDRNVARDRRNDEVLSSAGVTSGGSRVQHAF
jgi:G:T-mismatch repair DNA endonuclease (very short patch repair protein)